MAAVNTYKCDVCSKIRSESNHWFLAMLNEQHSSFILCKWEDRAAEGPIAKHICSDSCATKLLQTWLQDSRV